MASDEFFPLVRTWLTVHLLRCTQAQPAHHPLLQDRDEHAADLPARDTAAWTWPTISFEAIDHATITGFTTWLLDTRDLSPASANQRLAAIKSFLSFCAAEDPALVAIWLDVKQIRPARVPPPAAGRADHDRRRGADPRPGPSTPAADVRDTTIILLLFDAAARVQEVLDLTIADIDTTRGARPRHPHRQRPKDPDGSDHGQDRPAPRPLPATRSTPARRDTDALLFYTIRAGRRQPMSQDNITYLLNKHATTARPGCPEIPEKVHAHQLRHARAMQMLRAGVPLPHIKEFLGHANIATTSIYASADNQMVREAIQKAGGTAPELAPIWKGDDDLILQLAGLK